MPSGQAVHAAAAAAAAYEPAAQAVQEEEPAAAANVPAAQSWQVEAPGSENRPAGQAEHAAAPVAAYFPAAHCVQPEAAAVPPPNTVPANPGAQTVHSATDALAFFEPAVKMPTGQAVQAAAPPSAA